MKASELRIGNYANHSELGVVEIIASGQDYIHCIYNGEKFYESVGRFSPIQLTEEWLLKFGFEKESDEYYSVEHEYINFLLYHSNVHGLYYHFTDSERRQYHSTLEIISVHQLQNLYFALTGEELRIKNM